MRGLVERMTPFGTTIFAEMSALATRTGAINLGQGFPDTDGPESIREAAVSAIRAGHNQYAPGPGILELRRAIADHQQRWYSLCLDPDTEVLVTSGATEAIAAAVLALCDRGDEVVVLEPYYDSYAATIALAGARKVSVQLSSEISHDGGARFALNVDRLAAAITPRTRLLLLNSPHNPTGVVLDADALDAVAELCVRHNLLAVCDEVYEHMTFEAPHIPLATRPGMRERTLTISSAGKTFSLTGWKIGWVSGPASLVAAVRTVKQFLTFVSPTPLQHAVAVALDDHDEWIHRLGKTLRGKRDRLVDGLQRAGLAPRTPNGTYFVVADIGAVASAGVDGLSWCQQLPTTTGVAAVPLQVFYDRSADGATLVRFAFCKEDDVLDSAIDRLVGGPLP